MSGAGPRPADSRRNSKKRDRSVEEDSVRGAGGRSSLPSGAAVENVVVGGGAGQAGLVEDPRDAMRFSEWSHVFQSACQSVHPAETTQSNGLAANFEPVWLDTVTLELSDDIDAVRKSETFTGTAEQIEMFSRVLRLTAGGLPSETLRLLRLQAEMS